MTSAILSDLQSSVAPEFEECSTLALLNSLSIVFFPADDGHAGAKLGSTMGRSVIVAWLLAALFSNQTVVQRFDARGALEHTPGVTLRAYGDGLMVSMHGKTMGVFFPNRLDLIRGAPVQEIPLMTLELYAPNGARVGWLVYRIDRQPAQYLAAISANRAYRIVLASNGLRVSRGGEPACPQCPNSGPIQERYGFRGANFQLSATSRLQKAQWVNSPIGFEPVAAYGPFKIIRIQGATFYATSCGLPSAFTVSALPTAKPGDSVVLFVTLDGYFLTPASAYEGEVDPSCRFDVKVPQQKSA